MKWISISCWLQTALCIVYNTTFSSNIRTDTWDDIFSCKFLLPHTHIHPSSNPDELACCLYSHWRYFHFFFFAIYHTKTFGASWGGRILQNLLVRLQKMISFTCLLNFLRLILPRFVSCELLNFLAVIESRKP